MTARRKRPSIKGSAAHAKKTVAALKAAEAAPDKANTEKVTFLLDADVVAELRAASLEVPPKAFGSTLSGLVERAVRHELEALRRKWNEGEPFKSSGPVQARRGRPPKA
jgi:hypothetical protein